MAMLNNQRATMYNYLWYPMILPGHHCLLPAIFCSSGLGGGFGVSCASDLSRGCAHLPKKKPVCPNLGTHIQCGVEMYGTHLGCLNFKWWVTPLPISTNVWEESSESDKSIQIIQSGKTVEWKCMISAWSSWDLRSSLFFFFFFLFFLFLLFLLLLVLPSLFAILRRPNPKWV